MKNKTIMILCMTTRQMSKTIQQLPHFKIDDAPNKFIRVTYKSSPRPEGVEQLIFDDLGKLHPEFAEIISSDEVVCELREAQVPLIMECFFNACGQCTYVSYLTTDLLIARPRIDEKLTALNDKLTNINVISHIPLNERDNNFYWKYNFILH